MPIRLPYSNPPKIGEHPPNWPKAKWQIRLICRHCGHWQLHRKADVHFGAFPKLDPNLVNEPLWCAEIECGHDNCKSRTKWHTPIDDSRTETNLFDYVMSAMPVPVCEDGHSLEVGGCTLASLCRVFEV